ncbi:MAG: hypothetical protein JWP01_459 [Myxococcales bacterium]|nr:hypothetical protein [Myxococcales bacterium]
MAAPGTDAYFDPLTMDRHTPDTTFGIDVGYEVWDEPPGYRDITVFGLNIGGHYMTPGGLGGYLNVPLSYVSLDIPPLVNDSELALGNVEAGIAYAKRFRGNTALVLHAGVALPTADDDGAGAFQAYASVPRYGDLVQRWPNSTWLRFGLSPMGRSGVLFWRADVGLDLALDDDNANEISPAFHVNVGGGVDLGAAQLLGELVTNVIDTSGDDSASTFALGARFVSGNLRPGLALMFPVGFDDTNDALEFALVLSLAVHAASR